MQNDLDIAIRHFDGQLACYDAVDPRAVSWSGPESQRSRFDVLVDVGDLNGARVLDVGSGTGALYGYLCERGVRPGAYVGIDIHPEMIARARARFPEALFELRNLLTDPVDDASFDYVVESGIFNLATPHWHDVTFGMLAAMFRACRVGVAANFLSRLSGNAQAESYYADPAEIVRFAGERLSRRFILRHDYRTNDFTLFVYR